MLTIHDGLPVPRVKNKKGQLILLMNLFNADVSTVYKVLLISESHSTFPIPVTVDASPAVTSAVPPLHHATLATETWTDGQTDGWIDDWIGGWLDR